MKILIDIRSCLSLFLMGSLLTLLGCRTDENAVPKTIVDQIMTDDQFTLLRVMIDRAEAADDLRVADLTFFAPNDAAFRKTGITSDEPIKRLNREQLRIILYHHLLHPRSPLASIPAGLNQVEMVDQRSAYLNKTNTGKLFIDSAEITQFDVPASNGVIHIIDRILLP